MRASPALASPSQINHMLTNHGSMNMHNSHYPSHHTHSSHTAGPTYSALPPTISSTPSTDSNHNHHHSHSHHHSSNSNLSDYAVYGEQTEIEKVDSLLDSIDRMVTAIRVQHEEENAFSSPHHHRTHHVSKQPVNRYECALYDECAATLCAPNDEKLAEIRKELKHSEKFIRNKYDFKERVIRNEYKESLEHAATMLMSKYEDRICKHHRLFKTEFAKQQRKIDKAKKKALALKHEQQQQQQQQTDSQSVSEQLVNGNGDKCAEQLVDEDSSDFVIEVEKYKRPQILEPRIDINVVSDSSATSAVAVVGDGQKDDAPTFCHEEMQSKWDEIKGLTDKEMEADVNTMVADQSNMSHKNHNNGHGQSHGHKNGNAARSRLAIRDILAMFPKCDVRYSSDKNMITVNYDKSHQALLKKEEEVDDDDSSCIVATQQKMSIKVGSYIACRYKKQADMVGEVVAISSKGIWCRLRKTQPTQGQYDTPMDYALNEIKLQSIEDGTVKIKLVH